MAYTTTALAINVPTNNTIPTGHFIRLNVLGEVIEVMDYIDRGTGKIFRKNADGTFTRVLY